MKYTKEQHEEDTKTVNTEETTYFIISQVSMVLFGLGLGNAIIYAHAMQNSLTFQFLTVGAAGCTILGIVFLLVASYAYNQTQKRIKYLNAKTRTLQKQIIDVQKEWGE